MVSQLLSCRVVSFDWPGYGITPGKPSERTLCKAAETVYKWIKEEFRVEDSDITVWGQSIGSVAAVYLASKFPVRYLVIQSGIASAFDVVF